MKSWSGIRKTLEQNRLAPSLQGRVRYLATRYRGAHDDMGRIALLIDDQEAFSAHPFQAPSVDWAGIKEQHPDLSYEERAEKYWNLSLEEGIGDPGDFYRAFREYDTQDVAASLQSEDPLVRVLAVLDRRVENGGWQPCGIGALPTSRNGYSVSTVSAWKRRACKLAAGWNGSACSTASNAPCRPWLPIGGAVSEADGRV